MSDEHLHEQGPGEDGFESFAEGVGGDVLAESLRGLPVRLEAELGRAAMPTGRVVGMPAGAVIELDARAEEPLQVFVNGLPFATGRLIVVDGTEWAIQLEEVAGVPPSALTGPEGA